MSTLPRSCNRPSFPYLHSRYVTDTSPQSFGRGEDAASNLNGSRGDLEPGEIPERLCGYSALIVLKLKHG